MGGNPGGDFSLQGLFAVGTSASDWKKKPRQLSALLYEQGENLTWVVEVFLTDRNSRFVYAVVKVAALGEIKRLRVLNL